MISNNDLPYNSQTLDNDWIIAKLESPLEMNSDVQAACLPSSSEYLSSSSTEDRCFTSGWGTLSSGLKCSFLNFSFCFITKIVQVEQVQITSCMSECLL